MSHQPGSRAQTAHDIRRTWASVRPSIEGHGGGAAATAMERYVKQIEAATTAPAYARVAKPFLDEVDKLEKVYSKQ